jgi:HSP20 family molecular chaperone IbpA
MAETNMVPIKTSNGKSLAPRFGFLDDFEAEMERFWRRPWSALGRAPLLRPFGAFTREALTWAPRMDVYEKDNAIVFKAELPGLKKEDVEVEVEGRGPRHSRREQGRE